MSTKNLDGLENRLSMVGHDFNSLAKSSHAIFLFGSRATNVGRDDSDWDLLCISSEKSIRSEHVDLICVQPERAKSYRWMSSELASHVAHYGVLVHGESKWIKRSAISDRAISKKREKIIRRVSIVHPWWNDFAAHIKQKHLRLIRNDLSRFNCLVNGRPVPPTPLLESTSNDGFLKLIREFDKNRLLPQSCVAQLKLISSLVS